MRVSTATPERSALISRPVDFWFLGGLSMLVFGLFFALRKFHVPVTPQAEFWIFWAPYFRACIEYPHLFASYKMAYAPERGLLRSHPWHLVAAPLLFAAIAVWALPLAAHLVLLGFGWHRMRQVWGCMLIYAKYDKLELDGRQRRATHAFLLGTWVVGYFMMMRTEDRFNFFGVEVHSLIIPDLVMHVTALALAVAWAYFLFEMFFKTIYVHRRLPGLNFMMPLVAMMFWWVAFSVEPAFFFYLAPAFHALQYMNVAWAADESSWLRRLRTFTLFIALGLLLERLPHWFPALPGSVSFIAVAYAVLSLHHYVLDSIVWKSTGVAWKRLVPTSR